MTRVASNATDWAISPRTVGSGVKPKQKKPNKQITTNNSTNSKKDQEDPWIVTIEERGNSIITSVQGTEIGSRVIRLRREESQLLQKRSTSPGTKPGIEIMKVELAGSKGDPLRGRQRVVRYECVGKKRVIVVPVLLDSGARTTLVTEACVETLGLEKRSALQPVNLVGAIGPGSELVSEVVDIVIRLPSSQEISIAAYVISTLGHDILLGQPVIERVPELSQTSSKGSCDSAETEADEKKGTIALINSSEICDTDSGWVIQISEIRDPSLDELGVHQLPKLLRKRFSNVVRDDLPPLDKRKKQIGVEHTIELKEEGRLPKSMPYPLTPLKKEEIHKQVKELLEKDFIVPSKSPASSPVVLVKKKDNTWRLCIDYRKLNDVTVKDPFPLPRIDAILAEIGSNQVFSTLDLHSGYHQVPITEEDQYKTAFVTPDGKYEWKVMPFGLVNAPSSFARMMADIFRGIPFVKCYLDAILVHSENANDHLMHLQVVLKKLEEHGLTAKKKKCFFFQKSVEFLGYKLAHNEIRPIQEKTEAINKMPCPKTKRDAQVFLGMINYYRRFIANCSLISKPINNFICEKEPWGPTQTSAVNELKKRLCCKPVLRPIGTKSVLRLTTDASKQGLGAVLEEVQDFQSTKSLGVIEYFSKSLQGAEVNYPVGELELLAIIRALQHFKYVLHGRKFVLRTDHISLLTIKQRKEPHGRIARWLDELSEYEFELQYIKGKENFVADALSRCIEIAAIKDVTRLDPIRWIADYDTDPFCAAALTFFDEHYEHKLESEEDIHMFSVYRRKQKNSAIFRGTLGRENNVLLYQNKVVVPQTRVQQVLKVYHDDHWFGGHFGIATTTNKVDKLYWPGKHKDIEEYVKRCLQCQVMKNHRNQNHGLRLPLPISDGRWKSISIDFLSGIPTSTNGKNRILVVVDRFSKRAHFIACRKTDDQFDATNMLYRYVFAYHGFPESIVSDRDTLFTGKKYKELTKRLGIKLLMSSANHPQTDGQTERMNRTLIQLLRMYTSDRQVHWDRYLPQVEFVYNSTYNHAIKDVPFRVDLGYVPNEPLLDIFNETSARSVSAVDLTKILNSITLRTKDFLTEQQVTMQDQNSQRQAVEYKIGDLVLLNRDAYFTKAAYSKLQPIYLGPFKIVKKINDNAYELDLPSIKKSHRVINVNQFKKFLYDDRRYVQRPPRTDIELSKRLGEITSVVGISGAEGIVYCKMMDVDPQLTIQVAFDVFNQIPVARRTSLLDNYRQLLSQSEEPGSSEES